MKLTFTKDRITSKGQYLIKWKRGEFDVIKVAEITPQFIGEPYFGIVNWSGKTVDVLYENEYLEGIAKLSSEIC